MQTLAAARTVILKPSGTFSGDVLGAPSRVLLGFVKGADIIQVGMAAGFVTTRQLRMMARLNNCPVVWTMMDHAPLTGGCHYALGCERLARRCGYCPALRSRWWLDVSWRTFRRKRQNLRGLRLGVVACCAGDEALARESQMLGSAFIEKIPVPVDTEHFKPLRAETARVALGLPLGRQIVLCGATNLLDKRKGISIGAQAVELLLARRPDLRSRLLLVIAGGGWSPGLLPRSVPVQYLGLLRDERSLALAYQAADVLLSSSLADSGPMMVLEALSCGTPVAAFPVGYAADLIPRQDVGRVGDLGDALALSHAVEQIIMLPEQERARMRRRCREVALSYCSPRAVAAKYVALYHTVLCNAR